MEQLALYSLNNPVFTIQGKHDIFYSASRSVFNMPSKYPAQEYACTLIS